MESHSLECKLLTVVRVIPFRCIVWKGIGRFVILPKDNTIVRRPSRICQLQTYGRCLHNNEPDA